MNGEPVYYCAQCSRVLHASQVTGGTHRIARLNGADGYRFETHTVTPMPAESDRPVVLRLSAEEATLAKHALGLMVLNLLANNRDRQCPESDSRIAALSGIVVRLQAATEAATALTDTASSGTSCRPA